MTKTNFAKDQLKSVVERIERLEEEKAALAADINIESARLGRATAEKYEALDGRRRFVAGAVGPTNKTLSLSPDGRWAMAVIPDRTPQMVLWPTGPGQPIWLPGYGLTYQSMGRFTNDSKHVLWSASSRDGAIRYYRQAIANGGSHPEPLLDEGTEGVLGLHGVTQRWARGFVALWARGFVVPWAREWVAPSVRDWAARWARNFVDIDKTRSSENKDSSKASGPAPRLR